MGRPLHTHATRMLSEGCVNLLQSYDGPPPGTSMPSEPPFVMEGPPPGTSAATTPPVCSPKINARRNSIVNKTPFRHEAERTVHLY
jgi:hypothetical protein